MDLSVAYPLQHWFPNHKETALPRSVWGRKKKKSIRIFLDTKEQSQELAAHIYKLGYYSTMFISSQSVAGLVSAISMWKSSSHFSKPSMDGSANWPRLSRISVHFNRNVQSFVNPVRTKGLGAVLRLTVSIRNMYLNIEKRRRTLKKLLKGSIAVLLLAKKGITIGKTVPVKGMFLLFFYNSSKFTSVDINFLWERC